MSQHRDFRLMRDVPVLLYISLSQHQIYLLSLARRLSSLSRAPYPLPIVIGLWGYSAGPINNVTVGAPWRIDSFDNPCFPRTLSHIYRGATNHTTLGDIFYPVA